MLEQYFKHVTIIDNIKYYLEPKQFCYNTITPIKINQEIVKLEKAPKIAVYTPKGKQPWDDAS